jgi:hypothetical protein
MPEIQCAFQCGFQHVRVGCFLARGIYILHALQQHLYGTFDGPFSLVLSLGFSGLEASDFVIEKPLCAPLDWPRPRGITTDTASGWGRLSRTSWSHRINFLCCIPDSKVKTSLRSLRVPIDIQLLWSADIVFMSRVFISASDKTPLPPNLNRRVIDEFGVKQLMSSASPPHCLLTGMRQEESGNYDATVERPTSLVEAEVAADRVNAAPLSSIDPSCPDLVPDLDDIIRSFGSRTAQRSSAFNRLCQKTVVSYEDHDDYDGISSGTSSYNSGFSSSSDSTISSDYVTSRKEAEVVNTDAPTISPSDSYVTPYISTKVTEYLIRVSKLNKRKASGSTGRTPKLPVRSKRLGKNRPTLTTSAGLLTQAGGDERLPPSMAPLSNYYIKSRMRNTSKPIAHLWTREKSMNHVASVLSEASKNFAGKMRVVVEPLDTATEDEPKLAGLEGSTGQTVSTGENNMSNVRLCEVATWTERKREDKIREKEKLPRESRPALISTPVLDRADHFMERFDCDTGEIVAEGGFKSLLKPIVRGFDCDTGDLVTAHERFAAQILVSDLLNSSPNEATLAVAKETRGPALCLHSLGGVDVSRDPPSPTSVIENMELFFSESDGKGIKKLLRDSVDSSVSSISTNSSLSMSRSSLDAEECDPLCDESGSLTGTASLSDQHKARHLRSTKVLVRKSNKGSSRSLLSSSLSVTYTRPLNMRGIVIHRSISILLVQPAQKVFEIVSVDVTRSTLLKDTLQAACLAASNPVLARQIYVSLCGDSKVLSNMTSPMSKLMVVPKPASVMENVATEHNREDPDNLLRREMERRLLVAIPEKSDVTECQTIRRVLWKNPKLQVWWNMQEIKGDDLLV